MELQKRTIQTIHHLMTTGANEIEICRYERNLTIKDCVLSKEKPLYVSCYNIKSEGEILKQVFKLTQRFLMVNFPDTSIDLTASQFSQDIIALRRDWNLDDIVMFFKFIRQRQDIPELKTYGAKITTIKLLEFSGYYENERCEIKEQFLIDQRNKKIEIENKNEVVNGLFKATFGKELLEKQEREKENDRKEKLERAVKTNQYHKENEFCINWLKGQKATDLEKTTWFNLFSIR